MATGRIDTAELTTNFPYTAMFDYDNKTLNSPPTIPNYKVSTKADVVHHWEYSTSPSFNGCPLSVVRVNGGVNGGYSEKAI